MTTTRIAQPAPTNTREQRGLDLYREHAEEIIFSDGVWLVPSQHDSTSVYEVTVGRRGESCECRDFEFRGPSSACKHIAAATVARAKTAACSGCGERFPRRETVEVGPEMAEMGAALEGERFCRPCARRCGVL